MKSSSATSPQERDQGTRAGSYPIGYNRHVIVTSQAWTVKRKTGLAKSIPAFRHISKHRRQIALGKAFPTDCSEIPHPPPLNVTIHNVRCPSKNVNRSRTPTQPKNHSWKWAFPNGSLWFIVVLLQLWKKMLYPNYLWTISRIYLYTLS